MCFGSILKWNILASQIILVLCSHLGWMDVARFPWTMSMITLCLWSLVVSWIKLCLLLLFVCVQGSFFVTFHDKWPGPSEPVLLLNKTGVYISCYCCALLEAGNGDAWSEGEDPLGQDGRVLPENGGGMPSVQERLATLNEASECWNIGVWFPSSNEWM